MKSEIVYKVCKVVTKNGIKIVLYGNHEAQISKALLSGYYPTPQQAFDAFEANLKETMKAFKKYRKDWEKKNES